MVWTRHLVSLTAIPLFLSCAGAARAEVAVAAGHTVSLATMSSVDQACHSLGPVSVGIVEPPHGGSIEVQQIAAYPNFSTLNTRSRCNTMKLPATRVIYQSDGTYLGLDFVTIEAIFPGGGVRRMRLAVSVRPAAPEPYAPPPVAESMVPVPPRHVAKKRAPSTAVAHAAVRKRKAPPTKASPSLLTPI